MGERRGGLSSNALKVIAIAAMTIDHLAWTLAEGYSTHPLVLIMHIIGRLTAPIMIFLLCEGFYHTRNIKSYIIRLFILAFVSHFAYCFAFDIPFMPFTSGLLNQTGVIWGYAWGLILLYVFNMERLPSYIKVLALVGVCVITLPADWSCIGALGVLFMGVNRGDVNKQFMWFCVLAVSYAAVYCLFVDTVYGLLQLFVVLAFPLIRMYNGKKGRGGRFMKYFFYVYYPAHLFLCGLI